MSSFYRLSHFESIFDNFFAQAQFSKNTPKIDVLGPVRGKITIYESNFQQVNLTPNGRISSTVYSVEELKCFQTKQIVIKCIIFGCFRRLRLYHSFINLALHFMWTELVSLLGEKSHNSTPYGAQCPYGHYTVL